MALLLEFFSAWIQEKLPNFDLNQIENSSRCQFMNNESKSKFQSELKAIQIAPHFFNNKVSIFTNYFADLPNRVWKSVDYYYATQTTPWAISTPKNSYKNVWILLPGEERRGLLSLTAKGHCNSQPVIF